MPEAALQQLLMRCNARYCGNVCTDLTCVVPFTGGAGPLGRLQGDICKAGAHAAGIGHVHAGEERWPQAQAC